jgi:hypothetical protein
MEEIYLYAYFLYLVWHFLILFLLILNCQLGLNSQFGFQGIFINIANIKCTNKWIQHDAWFILGVISYLFTLDMIIPRL